MKYPKELRPQLIHDVHAVVLYFTQISPKHEPNKFQIIQEINAQRSYSRNHPRFLELPPVLSGTHLDGQCWLNLLYKDHDLNDDTLGTAIEWALKQPAPQEYELCDEFVLNQLHYYANNTGRNQPKLRAQIEKQVKRYYRIALVRGLLPVTPDQPSPAKITEQILQHRHPGLRWTDHRNLRVGILTERLTDSKLVFVLSPVHFNFRPLQAPCYSASQFSDSDILKQLSTSAWEN